MHLLFSASEEREIICATYNNSKQGMNILKDTILYAVIICTKSRDNVLTIIEWQKNGWLKVSVDGEEAYVLYENGKYGTISG